MTTDTQLTQWETAAYQRGEEDAISAATWCADGNSNPDERYRVLRMLEDGDPEAYDYLPPEPNLSGEWADSLLPLHLAREITGEEEPDPDAVDAIADAYETGVSENYAGACERELARFVSGYPKIDADRILRAILADAEGKGSDAPGSQYGTYINQWAPVAAVACAITAAETGESAFTEDGAVDLDWCHGIIGLVVNDHPDPGYFIAQYGPWNGFEPADYLDDPDEFLTSEEN
jgi:hypothetical protein